MVSTPVQKFQMPWPPPGHHRRPPSGRQAPGAEEAGVIPDWSRVGAVDLRHVTCPRLPLRNRIVATPAPRMIKLQVPGSGTATARLSSDQPKVGISTRERLENSGPKWKVSKSTPGPVPSIIPSVVKSCVTMDP